MPLWAAITVGVGVFLVMAALAIAGFFAWRAYTKRVLLRLVSRTEAIESAASALVDALARLSETQDTELEEFANDPESSERRVLHEVASRSRMLADELDTMAVPGSLVPLADSLGDAAYVVGLEAARVGDERLGSDALEDLARIDLASVRGYTQQARYRLRGMCEHYGIVDTVVYGGGLYL